MRAELAPGLCCVRRSYADLMPRTESSLTWQWPLPSHAASPHLRRAIRNVRSQVTCHVRESRPRRENHYTPTTSGLSRTRKDATAWQCPASVHCGITQSSFDSQRASASSIAAAISVRRFRFPSRRGSSLSVDATARSCAQSRNSRKGLMAQPRRSQQ